MSEWQAPPIPHDDEDWLRQLAASAEEDQNAAAQKRRMLSHG
jgi:hypothetical protein